MGNSPGFESKFEYSSSHIFVDLDRAISDLALLLSLEAEIFPPYSELERKTDLRQL